MTKAEKRGSFCRLYSAFGFMFYQMCYTIRLINMKKKKKKEKKSQFLLFPFLSFFIYSFFHFVFFWGGILFLVSSESRTLISYLIPNLPRKLLIIPHTELFSSPPPLPPLPPPSFSFSVLFLNCREMSDSWNLFIVSVIQVQGRRSRLRHTQFSMLGWIMKL